MSQTPRPAALPAPAPGPPAAPSAAAAHAQARVQIHTSSPPVSSSPTPASTPPTPDSPANIKASSKPAPASASASSADAKNVCINCNTETTPLWRRDAAGNTICNACGLHLRLHGVMRQVSDKQLAGKTVIRRRNRTSNAASSASAAASGDGGSARGAKGRRQSQSHALKPKTEQQPPAIINLGDLPAAASARPAPAPAPTQSPNQNHPRRSSLAAPVQQLQQPLPSIRTLSAISHTFPNVVHLPKPAGLTNSAHGPAQNQLFPLFSSDEHKPFGQLHGPQNTWQAQSHLHLQHLVQPQPQHSQNRHSSMQSFANMPSAWSTGSSSAITPLSTTVSSSSSPEFDGVDSLMILANASQAFEDGYQ